MGRVAVGLPVCAADEDLSIEVDPAAIQAGRRLQRSQLPDSPSNKTQFVSAGPPHAIYCESRQLAEIDLLSSVVREL